MKIKAKKLHPDAQLPVYATPGAACFDLHAVVVDTYTHGYVCKTNLAFEIPEGHVMLIFSRSGHGFNQGIRLANCVGVIDSDYRGEVIIKLHRDRDTDYKIRAGDRVAQAMIIPVDRVAFELSEELGETERGSGGFGSTGS